MALPFSLKISKEQIEGKEAVPEGIYKVRFVKFNPQWTRQNNMNEQQWLAARSINLNAEYEILEHPEYAGRQVFDTLNIGPKTPLFGLTDMCHAFGFVLPFDKATEQYDIPGMETIEKSPNYDPNKPETWEYRGPLLGKVAQVEIGRTTFNGKPQTRPRRWICTVPDCAKNHPEIRHSQNLIRN